MSTPYARLPGWADYGLIPLVNLLVAFVVAAPATEIAGNLARCLRRRHEQIARHQYIATDSAKVRAPTVTAFVVSGICTQTMTAPFSKSIT